MTPQKDLEGKVIMIIKIEREGRKDIEIKRKCINFVGTFSDSSNTSR